MKPWEEMYRAVIQRLHQIVQENEPMESVELIVNAHISIMSEYDGVPESEWVKYRGYRTEPPQQAPTELE
jgi:hypothetical protein